jgi:hypothetical protein
VALNGTDGDVSGVAAWDAARGRLAVVLVNFRDRYSVRRHARLQVDELPAALRDGTWQQWTIDATHSNVWHDQGQAELAKTRAGNLSGTGFRWDETLTPNSVTLVELLPK